MPLSAGIERQFPLQALKRLPRCFAVRRGVDDPQHRQLIAGRLTGQSAPAQSQLLAVFGVGGDVERHHPAQGRHFDLAAQRRFPRRHRQLKRQIAALQLVQHGDDLC